MPRRWLLACLCAGVLVAGLVRLLAPGGEAVTDRGRVQPSQAVTAGCADVLFLGADGGAETPPAGQRFGRTVGMIHRSYLQRATGSAWSVNTVRVDFDSLPIDKIAASSTGPANQAVTRTSAGAWRANTDIGVRRALGHLQNNAVTCPHQQIVLAGYSQGAMALHLALLQTTPQIRARVTAVALVGDPVRVAGTRAWLGGDPVASRAGSGVIRRLFGTGSDVPASDWTLPVWSVCNRGDVACDFGPTAMRSAIGAHRAYSWTEAGITKLGAVAGALWGRTTQHPHPTPDPTTLAAEVSKPVTVQLGVTIASSSRSYVRWGTTSALPPGLLLSPTGQVRGVPSLAGTWRVSYFVTSTQSAEFARRVPGTLVVTVRSSAAGSVSTGGGQTCSVRVDRSAWCWGRNNWGQVGDGATANVPLPKQVGTAKDWATIATSGSTTCGTRTAGALFCWGLNYRGQVGDGTTSTRLTPVQVGREGTWASVSNNWFHTCGVRRDGTLWCWGENRDAQLGDGTRTTRTRNVRIGTATNWASVAAGGWHTCATRTDGTLWCWGDNRFGQLGDGSTTSRLTPVRVSTWADWTSVSADWSTTCGVRSNGEARCWGRNTRGMLGNGTTTTNKIPALVSGGLKWASAAAGDSHSCGITTDGVLRCWGGSPLGALGNGSVATRLTPYPVAVAGPWRQVDAGWVHTCAVLASGSDYCWGSNEYGQLGNGGYTDALSPGEVK